MNNFLRTIVFLIVAVAVIMGGIWYKNNASEENLEEEVGLEINKNNMENNMTEEIKFPIEPVTELQIKDVLVGTGETAISGKTVSVHYTGYLVDGTKFDSSVDRGFPFSFKLGAGEVIEGWDKGIEGMKVGGKRTLIIPPSMGYGNAGVGSIPAGSTLVFETELVGIE